MTSRRDVEVLFAAAIRSGPRRRSGSRRSSSRAPGVLDADPAAERARKLATLVARDFDGDGARACASCSARSAASPANGDASPPCARRAPTSRSWPTRSATRGPTGSPRARRAGRCCSCSRICTGPTPRRCASSRPRWRPCRSPAPAARDRAPRAGVGFSARFRARGLIEVTLAPLSARASERLVRDVLGRRRRPGLVAALVRRAGGHPFHLEELVRAVADGRGADALPDSVLGMVQARLDDLGAQPRRLLRAASVFGETFWLGRRRRRSWGTTCRAREVRALARRPRRAGGRHAERAPGGPATSSTAFATRCCATRAYATLADARSRARAPARGDVARGDRARADPAVLAEHYDRGAAPEPALRFFRARRGAGALSTTTSSAR